MSNPSLCKKWKSIVVHVTKMLNMQLDIKQESHCHMWYIFLLPYIVLRAFESQCHNLSHGLTTKAKVCKVAGREGSQDSHNILLKVWKGVRERTLTPQGNSTLGVRVPVDSQIFKRRLQGSKLNGLRISLYHWKSLETKIFKMGSHCSFGHLKHKLWPKEEPGIKLAIWLPTTKSQ